MYRFKMWLAEFMRGRYGMDRLNRFMLIAAAVLIVMNMFLRLRLLNFLTVLLLIYIYCRMFSRNYDRRMEENKKFLEITSRFQRGRGGFKRQDGGFGSGGYSAGGFGKTKDREHRILRCPGCGERLRVPRGAGKIKIKCPHCGSQFTKKV